MREHIREEQLALYAAGDLPPNEAGSIRVHVQSCETCQGRVAAFRETRSFLAASLIDPSADELSEVRERVRGKLLQRRSGYWRWVPYAAGLATAAALIFIAVEGKPTVVPQPAPPVAWLVPPELPHLEAPRVHTMIPQQRPMRHQNAGIRAVDLIARADQPVMIKMTTADPNVVILWQSNEKVNNE